MVIAFCTQRTEDDCRIEVLNFGGAPERDMSNLRSHSKGGEKLQSGGVCVCESRHQCIRNTSSVYGPLCVFSTVVITSHYQPSGLTQQTHYLTIL